MTVSDKYWRGVWQQISTCRVWGALFHLCNLVVQKSELVCWSEAFFLSMTVHVSFIFWAQTTLRPAHLHALFIDRSDKEVRWADCFFSSVVTGPIYWSTEPRLHSLLLQLLATPSGAAREKDLQPVKLHILIWKRMKWNICGFINDFLGKWPW